LLGRAVGGKHWYESPRRRMGRPRAAERYKMPLGCPVTKESRSNVQAVPGHPGAVVLGRRRNSPILRSGWIRPRWVSAVYTQNGTVVALAEQQVAVGLQ